MGYDLHVTRAADWTEAESHAITMNEWLSYISSDKEMRLDNAAEAKLPDGGVLRVESPGLAVWMAYSGNGINGNFAWFDFYRGSIVVKNPDTEIIRKMHMIAEIFHARVIGDDGEVYGPDGNPK